ncbi:hypothetical protein [Paenibacillus sp. NRS-1780]|uniref:hypothetical protein n=1 Tax=Paenibacillus sp. NRS-1780 TaxID=3233904 RepID=UPI003D26CF4D
MENNKMIECKADEFLHLVDVMQKYGATCSLEFQLFNLTDPFFGMVQQPIKAEYFENYGPKDDGDAIILYLGESEFLFPLSQNFFAKNISDCQIFLSIVSETNNYVAGLNSSAIPSKGIEEANNFEEVKDVYQMEANMYVTDYERELVELIRTLEFDDILDAASAIHTEEESANSKAFKAIRTDVKDGFLKRAENLKKLGALLAVANDEYRNEIELSEQLYREDEQ